MKKLISLVLCVVLVFALMATAAFATSSPTYTINAGYTSSTAAAAKMYYAKLTAKNNAAVAIYTSSVLSDANLVTYGTKSCDYTWVNNASRTLTLYIGDAGGGSWYYYY